MSASAGIAINLATATAQNTGGAGTDTISTFENLIGSGLNDTLTGDGNANVIQGGSGNDLFYGQSGVDFLTGGVGADTFVFQSASRCVFINALPSLDASGRLKAIQNGRKAKCAQDEIIAFAGRVSGGVHRCSELR